MIRAQVVYGAYTALDTVCKRCAGGGQDPATVPTHPSRCLYCGGSGVVVETLGRPYTYLVPEGTKLWDQLMADAAGQTKRVTVVSLTSSYQGPCKEAYPLPTFPCRGCDTALPSGGRRFFCDTCWERVPTSLKAQLEAAAGPFGAVGPVRAITNYLAGLAS